jgi:tRNA pseudouridine13 synthase
MKLKQQADDFQVEEFPSVQAESDGSFAFYRLEKRGWTTPDALALVRRRWKIDLRRLSFGGLKDRHAHTIQYFTIHDGPHKDLTLGDCSVTNLGRLPHPYSSQHVRANGFTIRLRSLSEPQVARSVRAIAEVSDVGVPNYFDDQRFGSVGDGSTFVAREMVLGNFERALQLSLTSPYEHDRAEGKHEKAILLAKWGDWPDCRARLRPGHARGIVDYLIHRPSDFRGACARLQPELQGLYLSAWQSHLWNRMLSRWLTDRIATDQLMHIRLKTDDVVMPRSVPVAIRSDWDALALPHPSARLKLDANAPWASVVEVVMAEEGIPLDQMRIKGMHKPFFSKGERAGKVPVANLSWSDGDDDLNAGRHKLELRFELPRGCYATMLVKRLTSA